MLRKFFKVHRGKKVHAFTLMEILIVLVIIGILVLMALPDQTKVITKAKATEAKLQLQHLYSLQRAHYFEYGHYTQDLEKLGFTQEPVVTNDGKAYYKITVDQADHSSFRALATSVVDFDNDGTFNTWVIDQDKSLEELQPD